MNTSSSILTLNDTRAQKNAADARSEAKDTAAAAKRSETAAILRTHPQIGVLQRGTGPVYYAHVGVTRTYVERRNIHEIVAAVAVAHADNEVAAAEAAFREADEAAEDCRYAAVVSAYDDTDGGEAQSMANVALEARERAGARLTRARAAAQAARAAR